MSDVNKATMIQSISRRAMMENAAGCFAATQLLFAGNESSAEITQAIAGATSPHDARVFESARWLRNPRFEGAVIGDHISRKIKPGGPLTNIHTYFRKAITLDRKPTAAKLYITGDDTFAFYINNQFAVRGPERSYAFAHPFYAVDVTDQLITGGNALAAHVYYHGHYCRAFNSGDNRSGFMMVLDLVFADGSQQRLVTDNTWKCYASETFSADTLMGYSTQYNENMDLRKEPTGWREVGFDDVAWSAPLVQRQDHTIIPAIAAPLEHWRADPVKIEPRGEGRWFYDFGQEVVGHTRILLKGPAGHEIIVHHAEELNPDGSARYKMRCNCIYQDKITLTGQDDQIEFYDYRGFRYIEIHNAPVEPDVWVDARHYPFNVEASEFDCSEPLLNDIWRISKHGIRMGCQEVFVDCPTREKGQYTGDTYMTVLTQLILTGDPALTRKALRDFQLTQRFDPGLLAVAPSSYHQELAEWSLLWPVMLQYYYQMTGDKAFAVSMAGATLDKLMDWFVGMENEDGLLAGMDRKKWVLVDWPGNLRDNYAYDKTKNDVNTVVNAFYYGMLESAAELTRLMGRDDAKIRIRMQRLREAFVGCLLVPETNLFRDGANSNHQSLHASAFALRFGLVPEHARSAVVEHIRNKRLNCGLYGAHYFIEGLYNIGEHELAYDLLTSRDKHSWAEMLRHGATAPLEAWAPDQKWNTSFCHPCGATPIYLLVRYVMGLRPAVPGWSSVQVSPQLPDALDHMRVRFPTVAGSITAEYTRSEGYRLAVPGGVQVQPDMPENVKLSIQRL